MWENKTILIEYPFYQRHKLKLQELIWDSGYSAVTIHLYTDIHTVYLRGSTRDQLEQRHPGHLLNQYHIETYTPELLSQMPWVSPTFDELVSVISQKEYNIDLGLNISIDVTNFHEISYEEIYRKIVAYENTEKTENQ